MFFGLRWTQSSCKLAVASRSGQRPRSADPTLNANSSSNPPKKSNHLNGGNSPEKKVTHTFNANGSALYEAYRRVSF